MLTTRSLKGVPVMKKAGRCGDATQTPYFSLEWNVRLMVEWEFINASTTLDIHRR
jgi:hypothetical protein